jgi:cytochrome oxidase Cu insertion factor (SCO1/SenC/PrrC family)
MFRLRALLFSLAAILGCDRSSRSLSPGASETANVRSEARPDGLQSEASTGDPKPACCDKAPIASDSSATVPQDDVMQPSNGTSIPDVVLVNQDGQQVRVRSDLVTGKIVAVNFIFTSCKGICPPMSANFAKLQEQLGRRVGNGVELISVSVDPQVDTPERLHAWRKAYGGGRGWTLLTGKKHDVDFLLKELHVFAADKSNHSPFILLGDEAARKWVRVHGLTEPERLAEMITEMHDASRADAKSRSIPLDEDHPSGTRSKVRAGAAQPSPAENYFTNVELSNQHGERRRLYADLLKGKVVVINSFFSTCKGSCPVMMSSFSRIQQHFGDRVGEDLWLISITVDPQTDTPKVLAALAEQWKAKPGWQFLTGDKASVDAALHKLGMRVDNKESHSNVFIIGKESTGLWKKARGLSKPEELIPLIEEVMNDNP